MPQRLIGEPARSVPSRLSSILRMASGVRAMISSEGRKAGMGVVGMALFRGQARRQMSQPKITGKAFSAPRRRALNPASEWASGFSGEEAAMAFERGGKGKGPRCSMVR